MPRNPALIVPAVILGCALAIAPAAVDPGQTLSPQEEPTITLAGGLG
jgi:hypothetical protein